MEVRGWKLVKDGEKMIRSYKDLKVYKKSYSLALEIHQLTQHLPKTERYELGSQMRRAAISIPSNIAEGYGKKRSTAEFKRFLLMSLGSCNEIQVQINLSKDLGYIKDEKADKLLERYDILGRQLNTMIDKWF